MNLLDEMRFRGIFGTPKQDAMTRSMTSQPGTFTDPRIVGFNGSDMVKGPSSPLNAPDTGLPLLRKRDTPGLDEYRSYLKNAPKEEDNKMSKLGQALAAISGFATGMTSTPEEGINQFQGLRNYKFNKAKDEYANKGGRLKEIADLEYRGLTDEEKRQDAANELSLKRRDQFIKEIKTASDIEMNDVQAKNLLSQIEARNLSVEKNEKDGKLYVIDKKTGDKKNYGQFLNTLDDKTKSEWGLFKAEEGMRQSGRIDLQNRANSHAINLENIRSANDASLAKLRSDLTRGDKKFEEELKGMSPSSQKTAYELAYQQTMDDNGLGKDSTIEDPAKFMEDVRTHLKNIRGRTKENLPTDVKGGTPTEPTNPVDVAAKTAAVAWIKNKYPQEAEELINNPEAVQEAMDFIKEEGAKMQNNAPPIAPITVPQPPRVTLPQEMPVQQPLIPMNNRPVPQQPYVSGNPNPFSAMWNAIPPLRPSERARRGY